MDGKQIKKIRNAEEEIAKNVRKIKTKLKGTKPRNQILRVKSGDAGRRQIDNFRQQRDGPELLSALSQYHKLTKSRYLFGLVHPDIAVRDAVPVKLYSDIPVPTGCIGFHTQQQFTTNGSGCGLFAWRPNFLHTTESLAVTAATVYSNTTYNNTAGLTGAALAAGNSYVTGANYVPAVALQRYRLVSALMKVTYNGSILNQAGTMISCATFDPLPVAQGVDAVALAGLSDGLVDRFGQFSLISNGLWNTTVNITENSHGVECLYVPMDPDDISYQRTGSFFGQFGGVPTVKINPDFEGAHICYIVAARNLPINSSCILVDWYYNYEVIADPSAAPVIRGEVEQSITKGDHERLMGTITSVVKGEGFIKPSKEKTFKWGDVAKDLLSAGISYLPKLMSMI